MPSGKKTTQEEFIQQCKKVHGDTYILDDVVFTNTKQKIKVICKKHGVFSIGAGDFIYGGKGCGKCRYDKSAKSNMKTTEWYIHKCIEVHGSKYMLDNILYTGMKNTIKVVCYKHGEWEPKAQNFLLGHGCPLCNESHGEKLIAKILDNNGIFYIRQHKYVDCRGKYKALPFDFYIPSINTLIEYDGQQHFYTTGQHWDNNESFKRRVDYDNIKTEYCKTNNIPLVRVSYTMTTDEIRNLIVSLVSI